MDTLAVSEKLFDTYESLEEVKHYYGLLAIYALVRCSQLGDNAKLQERCRKILNRFPDEIEHPHYNFPSYRIGGLAKAFALMTGLMPGIEAQVREYAEELLTAPRDRKGIVKMPGSGDADLIWIDAAMAVTPYLLFAGVSLNDQRYIDEAAKQTFLMIDEFIDPSNVLLHQCKNFLGPGLYSEDHWSRGNGWGYLALTELVQYLPQESPHRGKAEDYFKDLSNALLPYQSKRGLWRQEIPFEYSYEESSGTALILYGYGVGLRLGLLDKDIYRAPFQKGIHGLYQYGVNPDYSTELSCPGNLCPGEGDERGKVKAYVTLPLPYRNEHHSFGPFILAFTEAYAHGIRELNKDFITP
ncbi:unsaturated rhamnogalacturonyl hydrolase [Paenibacillus rhizosphaerae]|uniref:Unsaturated rhamnogalacturonyl hydrolase n=1 Tax=Paenibacillus rhizosphaerae TaxID=297318 RepID=A0A839TFD6_9BACL|nr:glycoside hydrolase family 88 protein [Paenibacillus rhizosphaerae]MBB3125411.1 unsaturated rhamnogalacturonyl hydrolase [Paenibacillus rhizosphaerae]